MCPQAADGPTSQIRKSAVAPAVPVLQSVASGPAYQRRINTCKAELQQLVQQKREQCSAERMAKQMMESAEWESRLLTSFTQSKVASIPVKPHASVPVLQCSELSSPVDGHWMS